MIELVASGSFNKTLAFLTKASKPSQIMGILKTQSEIGIRALASATPVESGLAASSWTSTVSSARGVYQISWNNVDVENGFPVAIMLQYGYGTGTGGYVQGQDYINPAMRPVFDKIANEVWKAVTSG